MQRGHNAPVSVMGRGWANPSSSRGADRRVAAQKFPRNSDGEQIFSEKANCHVLHVTAANHAADGQHRARSAAKRWGKCTIWAREQSKQAAACWATKTGGALDNAAPFAVQ